MWPLLCVAGATKSAKRDPHRGLQGIRSPRWATHLHLFYTKPIFLEPRISEVHETTLKTEFLRNSNKRTSNIRGSRKISPLYKTSVNPYVKAHYLALCIPEPVGCRSLVPPPPLCGLVSRMRREGLSGEKESVKSMSWETFFQPLNPCRSGNS